MKKNRNSYHHGHLAESLLDAVDELVTHYGIEAVTLRACARLAGVSPSSAFRHYIDKRALLTVFATRALLQLCDSLAVEKKRVCDEESNAFLTVGMAYIGFALDRPAFFRAMWREETIYANDEKYIAAANKLSGYLKAGFVETIADEDPNEFSPQELLAWSSVHGLANLYVDGRVGRGLPKEEKLLMAREMITAMTDSHCLKGMVIE